MLFEGKFGAADDGAAAAKSNIFWKAITGATTLLYNKNDDTTF